jgi:hypothetical protein
VAVLNIHIAVKKMMESDCDHDSLIERLSRWLNSRKQKSRILTAIKDGRRYSLLQT